MLKFNPELHEYTWNDVVKPSVTQIIGKALPNDEISRFYTPKSRIRGTAVHKAVELLCADNLDEASLHEEIKPYIDAYKLFAFSTGFMPYMTEQRLYSPYGDFAGQIDMVGFYLDKLVVMDIKTGVYKKTAHSLQCSAYKELWNFNYPADLIYDTYVLQLQPKGKFKVFQNDNLHKEFYSCIDVYNLQRRQENE